MTQYFQLMKTLPPLVSVVVWDVINDRINELTIQVAAAEPKHPLIDLARSLVDEMVEKMALVP